MSELQNCPNMMCCSTNVGQHRYKDGHKTLWEIRCNDCGISTHVGYESIDNAVSEWNTRPIFNTLTAEVERLRERAKKLIKEIVLLTNEGYGIEQSWLLNQLEIIAQPPEEEE